MERSRCPSTTPQHGSQRPGNRFQGRIRDPGPTGHPCRILRYFYCQHTGYLNSNLDIVPKDCISTQFSAYLHGPRSALCDTLTPYVGSDPARVLPKDAFNWSWFFTLCTYAL